jgi:hypothetical protein
MHVSFLNLFNKICQISYYRYTLNADRWIPFWFVLVQHNTYFMWSSTQKSYFSEMTKLAQTTKYIWVFQVKVFWVVTMCSVAIRYCFRGPCCPTLKMETEWTYEMLVSYNTTWCHKPEDINLKHDCSESLKTCIILYILN